MKSTTHCQFASPAQAWLIVAISMLVLFVLTCGCSQQTSNRSSPSSAQKLSKRSREDSHNADEATNLSHSVKDADRSELIRHFTELDELGEFEKAAVILRRMILKDPRDYEAIFNLAITVAKQRRLDDAIELISEIPAEHPTLGISSLGTAASWCLLTERYRDAELRYRRTLALAPELNAAKRALALLLNRQGRRHEAVQFIRELCAAGDVTQAELETLIIESDAVCAPKDIEEVGGGLPNHAIGLNGLARYLWTQASYLEASNALRPLIEQEQATPADIAFYGATVVEAQRDDLFQWWLPRVTEEVKEYPEYWSAVGAYELSKGELNSAIRALGEAVTRDPTDIRSTRRLIQAFRSQNNHELAQTFTKRFESLMSTLNASLEVKGSGPTDPKDIDALARNLEAGGRRLEAVIWQWIAATTRAESASQFDALNKQRLELIKSSRSFPLRDEVLCNLDLKLFPLPPHRSEIKLEDSSDARQTSTSNRSTRGPVQDTLHFSDVAPSAGVNHAYQVATKDRDAVFAIYQTLGGAVAVNDYDRDGQVDLYLTQGAADPPNFGAVASDQLLRNVSGSRSLQFKDVTDFANATEHQYTLGATVGDWNQDGFSDIAVGNLGVDRLLINQGDGTFRSANLASTDSVHRLTTSIGMGDLNGDHLPDLYVLNYLDDPAIAKLPPFNDERLATEAINPMSFKAARDQVYLNDGQGEWKTQRLGKEDKEESTSLGIVITHFGPVAVNLPSAPHNHVFVANDELPNQLWNYDPKTSGFLDTALAKGCAYGNLGSPLGSMGVAAADFDGSGTLDLHVTNFYRESNSFYISEKGNFRDLNVRYGIDRVSALLLGFGCQAIDSTNRGAFDIAIANGHVENLEHQGQPFRQPFQILVNQDEKFVEATIVDPSGYCTEKHLGRALATCDLNHDGKTDMVVTGLMQQTALLLNQSVHSGHWIDLELIGTSSERDSVGAKVEVHCGDFVWTQWIAGGDGYLAKNEACLHFGLHRATQVDFISVEWPTGKVSKFDMTKLPVDQRYQCIEGELTPFLMR